MPRASVLHALRHAVVFSTLIVTNALAAAGQSPSSQGLTGSVVRDVDGRPVDRATVTVRELARTTESDSLGAFRMLDMPAGAFTLVVQRLGFGAAVATVTIETGKILDVEIALLVVKAQELSGVRVTADMQRLGKLAAFEQRRRAHSGGTFLQRAELDSATGRALSDVIRSRLVSANIVLYARTGAELIASNRGKGAIAQLPKADPSDERSPRACYSQVYVDGVQIYTPSTTAATTVPDMRSFRPESLAAIEYYSGPAVTPPEFGGTSGACGTLVLWTRER